MNVKYIWVWLIGAVILVILAKSSIPPLKGELGERKVAAILKKLPGESYRTINNVLVKRRDGKTVQIDHIVVSIYGIFVIETKNYRGIITGNDYFQQWTKRVYKKKYYFFSPTRQNYGHIKALEELLELPRNRFISIIVFLPGARLRVKSKIPVISARHLKKIIRSYRTELLDEAQVRTIENQIHHLNIYSKRTMKKHVRRLNRDVRIL